MPMYDFKCPKCHAAVEVFARMAEATATRPCHCGGEMHRVYSFTVQGDTHYDGLTTVDGQHDLSTRTKYRNYMRDNGLSLASDFKDTWAKAAKHRAALYQNELPKSYVAEARRDLVAAMERVRDNRR